MNIAQVREKAEDVFNTLKAYSDEAQAIERKLDDLHAEELRIRKLESDVNDKADQVREKFRELEEQKLYIGKIQHENAVKLTEGKAQIAAHQKKLEQIKAEQELLDSKWEEHSLQMKVFSQAKAEHEKLLVKIADLEKRESMIQKEIAIARERNQLLDVREKKVAIKEERIARLEQV